MAKKESNKATRMYNPPHPGVVLWELDLKPAGLKIVDIAKRLGVDRKTLSRVINGRASLSADMAVKLAKLFNTTPNLWLNMQVNYDLWHAEQRLKRTLATMRPLSRDDGAFLPA